MDDAHLSSQLEYLEQKFQDAQSVIAKLQQKVEAQEYQLQEQSHQVESLQNQLAEAQVQLSRDPQIDERLGHLRDEMLHVIERRVNRPQTDTLPANFNLISQQLDNHTKAISELRRELDKTERYDDQISLARTEATRLNKNVAKFQAKIDTLSRQLDERLKPLHYLEDQRRVDTRILTELHAELPELHKKAEANHDKIKIVEQKIPQFAKYEAALDSLREEIRRHREHMDYQIAQRERQLKDWHELADKAERHIVDSNRAMGKYAEHYQLNKRALSSLQDFQERLQNEQHRFGELQRLAEERQRADLEKFQADFEQRWQKRSMEIEPQFTELRRYFEGFQKKIDDLAKFRQEFETQLQLLMQIVEEDIQARTSASVTWQERFEEIATGNGQS